MDYRKFGVAANSTAWTGGCHNVFYTASSNTDALRGMETITLFVNSEAGASTSFAYEFAITLSSEEQDVLYTDDVFATKSVRGAASFEAQAQGGARVFANGLFIFASGVGAGGMFEVVDLHGGHKNLLYPSAAGDDDEAGGGMINLYDPFIRIVKPE